MESQKHIWDYAIPNEIASTSIKANWTAALEMRLFSVTLVTTLAVCGIVASFLPYYFNYIQARPGIYINDPILNLLTPINASLYIFGLLYTCVFICLSYISCFPRFLLKAAWGYCILTCLRMLVMLFVPLEAPKEMIYLLDPILSLIVYQEVAVTKDLFFSGHTATMFILACGVPNKALKTLFTVCTVIMAALLLKQHVHYTVDVLVAPLFAYVSWKLAEKIEEKVFGNISTITTESE